MSSREFRHLIRSAGRHGPMTGSSLAKRRRWYADEDDNSDDPPGAGQGQSDDQSGTDGDDTGDDPFSGITEIEQLPPWAQKLIGTTRKEAETYRLKLRQQEEAEEQARQKALEEQGEFKSLYEQEQAKLKAANEELEALKGRETERGQQQAEANEARIAQLAKGRQPIVRNVIETSGIKDDPYAVAKLLDTLLPELGDPNPPGGDGGSRGDGKGTNQGRPVLNRGNY